MDSNERFERAVIIVLKHEGGLINDPKDHGGITNYGISLRHLERLGVIDPGTGHLMGNLDGDGDVDADDIRMMSIEDAEKVYRSQWWDRYGYGRILDDALAFKVFDLAVNMGPGRAHRLLQQAVKDACTRMVNKCRLEIDGVIWNKTLFCINHCADNVLALRYFKQNAVKFYRSLHQNRFETGWIRRAME